MKRLTKPRIITAAIGFVAALVTVAAYLNAVPEPMRVAEPIALDEPVKSERFKQLQRALLGNGARAGNSVELLENGDEIIPAKLEAIENASHTITFETFEYWGEEVAKPFAEALAEAAERGVAVHAIFDFVGSVPASGDKFRLMEDAGVEVERWREPSWYQLSRFNHRTHRKLLVVDGEVGFTGGANTADPWKGNPETGGHRENHYRFTGPVVADLQNAFLQNWLNATGKLLYQPNYFPELEETGDLGVKIVNSSPQDGTHRVRLMFLLALAGAEDSIRIATPFFYPDEMIMDALLKARERGVSVDILLPGEGHYSHAVRQASMNRWGKLLEAGIRLHEYQPSKYHAKLYIVDDYWVSVGSANMDNRSFRLNDETNAIIMNSEFAQSLSEQFEQDLADSKTYDYETWENRPRLQRLLGWATMTIGWHL